MTYHLTMPSVAVHMPSKMAITLIPDPNPRTEVNVLIQPASIPNIGTLFCLGLTFIIARLLADKALYVFVVRNLWDRAKGQQM
jgi:hypothetical protein